nr:MAG TPA: hypothetical protein [Caudoviricetes sp.]
MLTDSGDLVIRYNEGWGFAVGEMRTEETYVYSTKH